MNLRVGKLRQTSGRLHSHGPGDWRRFFRRGGVSFDGDRQIEKKNRPDPSSGFPR